ncbi:MAG: sigma 54-interacting transcriptional regulator [Bacteroidales bacterium]|nr:sigma 54-interacting transcriptional regulator [Bacteroidales bacterium]MDD7608349.1 sigma 54-interacting transcriptional regulator [Bacteroidales bacterium]MDY5459942.1 sigma 54-interacting transcriptional regulator [Candidatus Cryptobacteroides sp.]MEE0340140.1 sigma 54-interacting transcriptional regulator [Bacteroidales bacterium]
MDTQELQRIKNRYDIIGNNAGLNYALETALAVAPSDLAVLVTGESGVGKDAIARIIHDNSRRKTGPYLAINCGAIPSGTINAELFGHEKGSFTGAIATRKGYFEEADGGTLFLDEIGELPKDTQALLLRVLQDGEYIKVGSSKIEKTDVRVVCATNANLSHLVAEGKFREDLYYRLNAIQIKLPALRERKDDIYLLFRKFTSDFSQKSGLCKISLTHEGIAALQNYRWPGNIRQLKNFTEALTVMESEPISSRTDRVELSAAEIEAHLPQEFDSLLPSMPSANPAASGGLSGDEMRSIVKAIFDLKQEVDRLKRMVESRPEQIESAPSPHHQPSKMIDDADWQENTSVADVVSTPRSLKQNNDELYRQVLEKNDGKVKPAAAELGVSERTIYRWLDKQKKNA